MSVGAHVLTRALTTDRCTWKLRDEDEQRRTGWAVGRDMIYGRSSYAPILIYNAATYDPYP
jgi:hypothetical protein